MAEKWSDDEVAALRVAAETGKTYDEAAITVGRSAVACYILALRNGLRLVGRRPGKWSAGETSTLRSAAESGKTYDEASATIGRTPGACYLRALKLKIQLSGPKPEILPNKSSRKPLSDDEIAALVAGAKAGKTHRELAAELGRPVATCYYATVSRKLQVKTVTWSKEDQAAIRLGCEQGLSYEAMAEQLDRTPMAVYCKAKNLEIKKLPGPRPYNRIWGEKPRQQKTIEISNEAEDPTLFNRGYDAAFCAAMVAAGYEKRDPIQDLTPWKPITLRPAAWRSGCSSSAGWDMEALA